MSTSSLARSLAFFGSLAAARVLAGLYSNITDCDEVFNYWEPLHFMLYGGGLQTWEYASQYALRSYLYLLLHAPVAALGGALGLDKVGTFYFVRAALGLACAASETAFLVAVEAKLGRRVAGWTHLFLLGSTGMFISR